MRQRIVMGLLAVGVLVEGVSLLRLQSAVTRLSGAAPAAVSSRAPSGVPAANRPAIAPPAAGRAPVPVFSSVTLPAQAAVMETIASPEGRQKLHEVLTAMKEQRRQEKLVKSTDRREKLDQRIQEIAGAELGLNPDEARKTHDILGRLVATRRHAVEELQSGLKNRTDAKTEIDNATRAADDQLKDLLGEKRLVAYRDLRRKTDRALRN
jgi:hypothetical protein